MATYHTCRNCGGSGSVRCPRCDGYGTMDTGDTCYYCQGAKTVVCPSCNGTGKVQD